MSRSRRSPPSLRARLLAWFKSRFVRSIVKHHEPTRLSSTEKLRRINQALVDQTRTLEATLRELREAQQQLVQSEKLAVVGQLAAGVAHEINNPCAFVLSNLRDLAHAVPPGDAELVKDSIDGIERIVRIVQDLKSFGRSEETEAFLDIKGLVERAVRMLSNQLRPRATVALSLETTPPVRGAEGRVLQVLLNLIANALQASRGSRPEDNRITLSTRVEGEDVVIGVSDTGVGIDPGVLGRIFDPFFTTKPAGEGIGLGLSVAKNIVESLGGSIQVDSTPGAGTCFEVRLPVADTTPSGEYDTPKAA